MKNLQDLIVIELLADNNVGQGATANLAKTITYLDDSVYGLSFTLDEVSYKLSAVQMQAFAIMWIEKATKERPYDKRLAYASHIEKGFLTLNHSSREGSVDSSLLSKYAGFTDSFAAYSVVAISKVVGSKSKLRLLVEAKESDRLCGLSAIEVKKYQKAFLTDFSCFESVEVIITDGDTLDSYIASLLVTTVTEAK